VIAAYESPDSALRGSTAAGSATPIPPVGSGGVAVTAAARAARGYPHLSIIREGYRAEGKIEAVFDADALAPVVRIDTVAGQYPRSTQ